MDSSYILVIKLIRLSDVLNVGYEGEREIRDGTTFLGLRKWSFGGATY